MKIDAIDIQWLGHASFRISANNKVIYIDPYQLTTSTIADIILITHSHYDHCSPADIEKIVKDGTIIVCTADSQSKVARISKRVNIQLAEAGSEFTFETIKIHAVESYNQNKKFHPKAEGWLGYIIQFNSTVVYHAGDTDLIKEMEKLTGYAK